VQEWRPDYRLASPRAAVERREPSVARRDREAGADLAQRGLAAPRARAPWPVSVLLDGERPFRIFEERPCLGTRRLELQRGLRRLAAEA